MRTAKTLVRLGRCPGWSESSLGAYWFCWFCHVVAHFINVLRHPLLIVLNFIWHYFEKFSSNFSTISTELIKSFISFVRSSKIRFKCYSLLIVVGTCILGPEPDLVPDHVLNTDLRIAAASYVVVVICCVVNNIRIALGLSWRRLASCFFSDSWRFIGISIVFLKFLHFFCTPPVIFYSLVSKVISLPTSSKVFSPFLNTIN